MAYGDAQYDEDDEADLHEREDPDAADADDGDESETVPCPYCGKAVYEGADVCPRCGSFIVAEDAVSRRPWWAIVAAVALLVAVLLGWVLSVAF